MTALATPAVKPAVRMRHPRSDWHASIDPSVLAVQLHSPRPALLLDEDARSIELDLDRVILLLKAVFTGQLETETPDVFVLNPHFRETVTLDLHDRGRARFRFISEPEE